MKIGFNFLFYYKIAFLKSYPHGRIVFFPFHTNEKFLKYMQFSKKV